MIKKFCTKHGVEYLGETCPECLNAKNDCKSKDEGKHVEHKKKEKPPKQKNKPFLKNRNVDNSSIDEKLKALMDKWNTKY